LQSPRFVAARLSGFTRSVDADGSSSADPTWAIRARTGAQRIAVGIGVDLDITEQLGASEHGKAQREPHDETLEH
jgi:hypothetical protein